MAVRNKPTTFTELILSKFEYPNPYKLNYVAPYRFVNQVGEFLVRRDKFQNLTGGLASSWTISEDRNKIKFHLRPNLYSAIEVAQSLWRLMRASQTNHSNLSEQVSSEKDIVVLDELTIEIRTIGDAGALLAPLVMADTVIIPDSAWLQKGLDEEPQVNWKVTKGPYIYDSGDFSDLPRGEITFKPNPNHYMFSPDQLKWKLMFREMDSFKSLSDLKLHFEKHPGYTTLLYWELFKIFEGQEDGIDSYVTRPNSVSFLMPNLKGNVFSHKNARISFLKKLLSSDLPVFDKKSRANQIPQPGLAGRLSSDELSEVMKVIEEVPDFKFDQPLIWLKPNSTRVNSSWFLDLADHIGLPFIMKDGPYLAKDKDWDEGKYDLMLMNIGMSDTDPISGATFLFSPSAANLDLPDGRILKILNAAKGHVDRAEIGAALKSAFGMALKEGLMFPISYLSNRHYYSADIDLNIMDPYSEDVMIQFVRFKNYKKPKNLN